PAVTETTPQLTLMTAMRFAAAPRVVPRSWAMVRRNGASAVAEAFTRNVTTDSVTSMPSGIRAASGAWPAEVEGPLTRGVPSGSRRRLYPRPLRDGVESLELPARPTLRGAICQARRPARGMLPHARSTRVLDRGAGREASSEPT